MITFLYISLPLLMLLSLAGIIYPFKPYRKRRNAALTLFGSFGLLVVLTLTPQTSTVVATRTDDVTTQAEITFTTDVEQLDEIRDAVEAQNWIYARDQYLLLNEGAGELDGFLAEIEPRVLELVRPIPASDHRANFEGYAFLSTIRPENELYVTKAQEYQNRITQGRENAISRLNQDIDRVEGITWFKHPNQPTYINSRSTVYLYIGRKGETGQPTLRMQIQYTSSNWLFVESVFAWHDGVKELLFNGSFERDNNSTIWEWVDVIPSAYQMEILRSIANTDEAILRFEGAQYKKDVTLSSADKRAIREVLLAYDVMLSPN